MKRRKQPTPGNPPFFAGERVIVRTPSGNHVPTVVTACRFGSRSGWLVELRDLVGEVPADNCMLQPDTTSRSEA